jgi:hypothetical protein
MVWMRRTGMNELVTTPLRPSDLYHNLDGQALIGIEAPDNSAHYTRLLLTLSNGFEIIILGDFTVEAVEPGYDP